MTLTLANVRRTVRKPSVPGRNTSIEAMRDLVCKSLAAAEKAFNNKQAQPCVKPNQDDPSLVDVSAFRSTKRIALDEDGTTAFTVANTKKDIHEAFELWRQVVIAGKCDKTILADSQHRKAALREAWAKKKADRLALVPVKHGVRR